MERGEKARGERRCGERSSRRVGRRRKELSDGAKAKAVRGMFWE